ncbi:MAG: PssE/Cps14G family polysaccharide biosynthesis glycosyltransferase, partial [Methanobacteriota archaeon]
MIFVTVGLHYQGFDRLIKAVDELALKIDEEFIAQIGSTQYTPKNMEYFREKTIGEVDEYFKDARIIISHAGIGSIITALKYEKPLIVVPRLKKYNEHTSNHQLEVTKALEDEGKASVAYETDDIQKVVNQLKKGNPQRTGRKRLIETLKA